MICEACRANEAVVTDASDGEDSPYHLCEPCHRRLHDRALRPVEWYNLASMHGCWRFLLHGDFYLDDGTADQPKTKVKEPEKYPAPTLDGVRGSPESVMGYCLTRWAMKEPELDAWRHLDPDAVLEFFKRLAGRNHRADVLGIALQVAGHVLGSRARHFVEELWSRYPEEVALFSLAFASARCLPAEEGYAKVVNALESLSEQGKRKQMSVLRYFRTAKAVDWVEANAASPVTEEWARLVAESGASWPRLASWLSKGRPLSLVALDTLLILTRDRSGKSQVPFPSLADPPDEQAFLSALERYAATDPTPRVRGGVGKLREQRSFLCRK